MEPIGNSQASETQRPFYDRPYEEEEDGYIDDRGFYTSPNGSFWDDDHNYFNHFGFDKHGGSYDKFGIYQPGPNYNPETGTYQDEEIKLNFDSENDKYKFEPKKMEMKRIYDLEFEEKKDKKTVQKFAELIESDNESDIDEDEDKNNVSYDMNDFEEAYNCVVNNENNNKMTSQQV